jgi:hypothetical protein
LSAARAPVGARAHYRENSRLSCQLEFTPALAGLRVTVAPDE